MSYVIITPYTIAKSRTGGVLSRLLSQTDLELVGAQVIAPDENFVRDYAGVLRDHKRRLVNSAGELLASYIERTMTPTDGRPHRFFLLLFRGEDACKKLSEICGALFPKDREKEFIYGVTIRDTYGDYIVDPDDNSRIAYFEPAILTPRHQELAEENLPVFARHFRNCENVVHNVSYPDPSKIEQTLVIIKPDNWNFASGRPGSIIDMFSRTGLRIIAAKVFRFSLSQAQEFYGPVEASLKEKLGPIFGQKAKEILEREFLVTLSKEMEKNLCDFFGQEYAQEQFRKIVGFMSGRRPDTCSPEDACKPGDVKCMILLYEGVNAVQKIRNVLGPTDPLKAPAGTVRREFGSSVMANTAHASDSRESCEREKKIVQINENSLVSIIDDYLAES